MKRARRNVAALAAGAGCLVMGLFAPATPRAQEFSRYLACKGRLEAPEKSREAFVELALRNNGRIALIQGSNILPTGETMKFVPTPANYSMTYVLPRQATVVIGLPGWIQSSALIIYPNLQRLNQIRLSVNRRSGVLDGRLLNQEDELLGEFKMNCESASDSDLGTPRF